MTTSNTTAPVSWRDYKELTKPNVVLLMILTAVIGMFMAVPGMVPLHVLILGNLGIALCAGSALFVGHAQKIAILLLLKVCEVRN